MTNNIDGKSTIGSLMSGFITILIGTSLLREVAGEVLQTKLNKTREEFFLNAIEPMNSW